MSQPVVSIIMTSYNKPDTVAAALRSVFEQTYSNWELWLMDDHSGEKVQAILSRFLNDPRVHYRNSRVRNEVRYRKVRYAVLINQALRQAKGKYITYLTDDTIYVRDRLEKMVHFLESAAHEAAYAGQRVRIVDEQLRKQREWVRRADHVLADAAFRTDHCSVMHRADLLQPVFSKYGSYWDENPAYWDCADAIFWRRLNEWVPFYPVHEILETAYKTPRSFQRLNQWLTDELIDGTVIRCAGQLMLIDREVRRPLRERWQRHYQIPSREAIDVPDPLLFRYREAAAIDDRILPGYRLCRERESGRFYYLEHHRKRALDLRALNYYRFQHHACIWLSRQQMAGIPDGPAVSGPWQAVFHPPGRRLFLASRKLWLTDDGVLREIDRQVCLRYKLTDRPVPLKTEDFHRLPKGRPLLPSLLPV
ncbi:MAG: glycosyltransferase [Sporolactobacillus sp.]|nr:glycosyltransferase [Sporolactobacillus sp.]